MIDIEDVSQRFAVEGGVVEALRHVDLTVDTGEFVTLVGRSGCGKSTLLRIIAGLLLPTSGDVTVAGDPVRRPRQDVAVMFQRPALLPWRTVLDNVLLPITVMHGDTRPYRPKAMELLETTGLVQFASRNPRELSGGMQQRVSLCRALIHDPDVLLMDEPFAALDALTREELSIELQRICTDRSKTVVFVTHSIDEAVLLADRVVVMSPRPGRVKTIVSVDVPRPRTLASTTNTERLAEHGAVLRDLLFERTPDTDATATIDGAAKLEQTTEQTT